MAVVRSIGQRYLWVDALSIVQDDEETKHHWILNMGAVYGKSYLTIVAADGDNANTGLMGLSDPSQRPQQQSAQAGHRTFVELEHSETRKKQFEESIYNSRAWT
jgi:hypothetical protein